MTIWIILLFFIVMFFLPFIPGFVEMAKKEDANPLQIPMGYIRDPRYFAKSFRQILKEATENFTLSHGIHKIKLSKEETLEVTPSIRISDETDINHLLFIKGNLTSGMNVKMNKEVYITGYASIGPNNVIQALSSEARLKIGQGTRFYRWIDSKDDITVDENCNLGICASSGNKISLGENCIFRRIFGRPVTTGQQILKYENAIETPAVKLSAPLIFKRSKDTEIQPETVENSNVVFIRDVRIGYGSSFGGNIKCYGDIVIENDVSVYGNVLADGDIIIGRNAKIMGHLFSQTAISISEGSLIGHPDKIKSIIAKKSINIENGVTIYGYISTEGTGTIGKIM